MKDMLIFPLIRTDRLILRQFRVDDFDSLIRYVNNPKIANRILNISYPYTHSHAVFRMSYVVKGFKERSRFIFAIVAKEREELIGEISLHLDTQEKKAEIGYWIGEPHWNQGFASEATEAILDFGFSQLGLTKIFATSHVENSAAHRVLLKNGMAQVHERGNVYLFEIENEVDRDTNYE